MSNMSRGRKLPSQQTLRNSPKKRPTATKKIAKQKGMSRLRRSTREYSKGSKPSGDTGRIPMPPRGGESGQFIDADGKRYTYVDKPGGAGLKKPLRPKRKPKRKMSRRDI